MKILVAGVLIAPLLLTAAASAQVTPANPSVTMPNPTVGATPTTGEWKAVEKSLPAAGLISIPIPESNFSNYFFKEETKKNTTEKTLNIPWLAQYISGVYKYAVGIAGVLAAVVMMIGGMQYLLAGGDASRVAKGKEKISDALLGLVLVLGTYMVLSVINPDLVSLGGLEITTITPKKYTLTPEDQDEAVATTPPLPSGKFVCGSIAECKTYCEAHPYTGSDYMTVFPAYAPEDLPPTTNIPNTPGLINYASGSPTGEGTSELLAALKRAGEIAKSKGFELRMSNSTRPLQLQLRYVCNVFKDPKYKDRPQLKLFSLIGKPNTKPVSHAAGDTVDICISGNGISSCGVGGTKCATNNRGEWIYQFSEKYKRAAQELLTVMTDAGFQRYSGEIWHFELHKWSGSTCQGTCPDTWLSEKPACCDTKPPGC